MDLTRTQRIVVKGRRPPSNCRLMKCLFPICSLAVAGSCVAALGAGPRVNVTQYHNDAARAGLYIDAAFTPAAAANLRRDLNFDGTISGAVYAQPLYIEGGPSGRAMVIVVTESNNVYTLDAGDGSIIWQLSVGAPVKLSTCTKIDPLGITGTPIVNQCLGALFLERDDGAGQIASRPRNTLFSPLMWIRAILMRAGPWTWARGLFLTAQLLIRRCKGNAVRSASWVTFFMCPMGV